MQPAIIIAAYNRIESLRRLLNSITNADYTDTTNITLIISFDDCDNQNIVTDAMKDFHWQHGELIIIRQATKLGLKNHILYCGNLTQKYENIILLEDDLFVSPFFYQYALQALNFYSGKNKIGGISLYNHTYNESALLPFTPLDDGYDNYFMQIASSWGLILSKIQWQKFYFWLQENPKVDKDDRIPDDVINWPNSSWKKHFIKYLVYSNKYFVYPRISLTTNFNDAGKHHRQSSNIYQTSLCGRNRQWMFSSINDSMAVYDTFCELHAEQYKKLNPELAKYDFTCDLYGVKQIAKLSTKFILTSKPVKLSYKVKSFGLQMKPIELNIKYNISGNHFNLIECNEQYLKELDAGCKLRFYEYFYSFVNRNLFYLFIIKIKLTLQKKLKFNG